VILAISDALALMDLKKVSKADYGLRHHGGYLGRKRNVSTVLRHQPVEFRVAPERYPATQPPSVWAG
jgi:hypothetical protein